MIAWRTVTASRVDTRDTNDAFTVVIAFALRSVFVVVYRTYFYVLLLSG